MNSEKMKEIKEKLQEEIFIAHSFGYKLRKVPTNELENLLTYINELENLCNKTYEDLTKEIDRLENRVKELEDGIAKSMLGCEFLPECTKEKEKEVAKKILNELYHREEIGFETIKWYAKTYWEIEVK